MSALNVNLKHCDTPHLCAANGGEHVSVCAASPVLIPCPIPPTFGVTVRLGECSLGNCYAHNPDGTPYSPETGGHGPGCPARPIRVTCAIGGDGTWAGSEVTGVSAVRDATGAWIRDNHERILSACRDRLALVKALVLGADTLRVARGGPEMVGLITQRDAVYAALADMARWERGAFSAQDRALSALQTPFAPEEHHHELPERRPSAAMLAKYVERLIEQVATL